MRVSVAMSASSSGLAASAVFGSRATWTADWLRTVLLAVLLAVGCDSTGRSQIAMPVTPAASPAEVPPPSSVLEDPFAQWNDLPQEPWWRDSAPYSCREAENPTSPWLAAGMPDLGGSDPLSLIRYFGNGSYLRYGHMGFGGCTPSVRDPNGYLQDPPADPTYYSRGDLKIFVDVARVPPDASGWFDDGTRVDFSMEQAVTLLNAHVAAYYRRVSANQLRIAFWPGEEFEVPEDGSPSAAEMRQFQLVGACREGCRYGAPGGLNRILLNDVAADTGGYAYNGWAFFGLATFAAGRMGTIVHEIGHGWMAWPHSFAEVPWRTPNGELDPPNPYSNLHDIMSSHFLTDTLGWDAEMPSTLAVNRYAAGWIRPEDVAMHVRERATYTLVRPRHRGHQFVVVHSGRRHAFTTLEVLDEIPTAYRRSERVTYDALAPERRRVPRYEGVFVARYDQTAGTGTRARLGPAFYNSSNPRFLEDVGWGYDDHALIPDGQSRDIGGGVRVAVSRNGDGSYEVTVAGGRMAPFDRWCFPLWFLPGSEYDTGCFLDTAVWE